MLCRSAHFEISDSLASFQGISSGISYKTLCALCLSLSFALFPDFSFLFELNCFPSFVPGFVLKDYVSRALFVGGPGNTTGLERLPVRVGFRGCVRHLEANEHHYRLALAPQGDTINGFDVGWYTFCLISNGH